MKIKRKKKYHKSYQQKRAPSPSYGRLPSHSNRKRSPNPSYRHLPSYSYRKRALSPSHEHSTEKHRITKPLSSNYHSSSRSNSFKSKKPRKGHVKTHRTKLPRINGKQKIIISVGFLLIACLSICGFLILDNNINDSNDEEWKFIVYGDTQENSDDHRDVLNSISEKSPNYEFIISPGDVVGNGNLENDWKDWKGIVDDILGNTGQNRQPPKYLAAPGNHDNTGDITGLTNWKKYLSGQSLQFGNDGLFFVLDYINARFIFLNSDSIITGLQYNMMINAINNNPKTWLFAIWHHPMFCFGQQENRDDIYNQWGVPLYDGGCDIIFSGHAHHYVRTKKLELDGSDILNDDSIKGTTQVISGNGGATISTVVPNGDGNEYMLDGNSHYSDHGYTELIIKGNQLKLRHYSVGGIIVDDELYNANPKPKKINSLYNNFSISSNISSIVIDKSRLTNLYPLIPEMTLPKFYYLVFQIYSIFDVENLNIDPIRKKKKNYWFNRF